MMTAMPEAESFSPQQHETERSHDIQILEDLLKDENPDTFGPYWIECQDKSLSARLRRKAKAMGGWQALAESLHEPWRSRFQQAKRLSSEQKEKRPYELARELTEYLEKIPTEKRPQIIYPEWIHANHPQLYEKLNLYVHKKAVDWNFYVERLPAEWRVLWQKAEASTLEQDMGDLKELLEKEKPESFSWKWIETKNSKLYSRLTKKIKKSHGKISWLELVKGLGDEWSAKWKPLVRDRQLEESRAYEDESEVQSVLDEFKGGLYTIVTAKSREEIEIRNEICGRLAALSQRGNLAAKKTLRDMLELFLQETIDAAPSLIIYKMEPEKLNERYEACLAHWNPGTSFLKYLMSSLFFYAKQLDRPISLETGYGREEEADWFDKVGRDQEGELVYYPNRKRGRSA